MVKISKNEKLNFKVIIVLISTVVSYAYPPVAVPDGFAKGTTGGGNATPIVVKSASEFKNAVEGNSAAVIIVQGRIDLGGIVSIGSNKTIIGADSKSGVYGGTVKSKGKNIIIQNMSFGPSIGDVMEFSRGANKVFIKNCEFHDSSDELLSIVHWSDSITICWCRFYFDKPESHSFAHLIGHEDSYIVDRGKFHVTFHHNWYDKGVVERMPRVRYGKVHIYNNYYASDITNYVIGVGVESQILLEGSYFKDQGEQTWYDWKNGKIQWTDDNIFSGNTKMSTWAPNSQVFKPPYDYKVDKTENVPDIVMAGAGNKIVAIGDLFKAGPSSKSSNLVDLINFRSSRPRLQFNLDKNTDINIVIYDITGRAVTTVLNRQMSAGSHSVKFNRSDLSSGVYYLRFRTKSAGQVLKVVDY